MVAYDFNKGMARTEGTTWYNIASNACKAPNGITESSSPLDDSLEVVKKESVLHVQSHSNGNHPCQSSNVGGNNIDMGSTTSKIFTNPVLLKSKSEAISTVNGLHSSFALKPIKDDPICTSQQVIVVKADNMAATAVLASPRGSHPDLQLQHLHRHHHHFLNMEQEPLSNHGDLSLKKLATDAPHCGSSNVLGGPLEGNTGNCSLNRSASCCNHGSNGQNESSTAVNAGGTNMESDNGLAGKSRSGNASGSGSGNRIDQNKYA